MADLPTRFGASGAPASPRARAFGLVLADIAEGATGQVAVSGLAEVPDARWAGDVW
jgi:hypothetical protein